jgi:NADH:ubiquinone reductase (H+-translocating)
VEKKKILIVGGGFGGVFAAKELARRGRGKFDIELINNNNYFVFQPLLPEVAAATIHSSDAVAPLRLLLRHTQIRQADVMGIDFAKKTVTVVQGSRRVPVDLPYDELVIALGMGVDLNRFPGLPEHGNLRGILSCAAISRTIKESVCASANKAWKAYLAFCEIMRSRPPPDRRGSAAGEWRPLPTNG